MGKTTRLTTEEFIKRAKEIHGNKYNYSMVEYINYETKVCIICPIHGKFWQTPLNHLVGKGCKKCGIMNTIKKEKLTTEEFIKKAKEIHGDKYDYSKVKYIDSHTKVCVICPIHGEFWQSPTNHLSNNGCPKCYGFNKTNTQIIAEFKRVHGNKYDYSNIEYNGAHKKVCVICPTHGEFWVTPSNHLRGCGCPKCKSSIMENKVMDFLKERKIEYIYEYAPHFLKVGKSHQSLDFFLPKYNIAIECQGIQHFEPVDFANKGYDWAEKLYLENKKRDKKKNSLCKENGVKLFYINYYDNLNNELEKVLKICSG